MRRRTWGIAAAVVVVLAAAGTTVAVLASGNDDGDYKTLPKCEKLGAALPGKPALSQDTSVTDAEAIRGLQPAFTNVDCRSDKDQVHVELYQASDMDLQTTRQYKDKAVHDGSWRANDLFARMTNSFDELKPGVRYGSSTYSNSTCTVLTVKRNAIVTVTVPNPVAGTPSVEKWKATCRDIAQSQVPKVVDAALG